MHSLQTIFIVSLAMVTYAYLFYPVTIYIFGLRKKNNKRNHVFKANITVIISAFNEEKRIERKLINTINSYYPEGDTQIIVASDGSTDRTQDIVKKYKGKGIELLEIPERKGKEYAQKEALKQAKGEIIVFTDVSTILAKDSIRRILSNFSDPTVGCVSSKDKVIGIDGKQSGENIYVLYEMWLRRLESRVSSPVGLSGSFFAARKSVCEGFSAELDSDFWVLLNSVKKGMRGTCDQESIGYYQDLSDPKKEFDRKVRTVVRGLTLFFKNVEFLNIFRYGLFSYQLFCHKLLRWLVPFFLIVLFGVNIPLSFTSNGYALLLLLQCGFYGLALVSLSRNRFFPETMLFKIPSYFVTVNASILVAWFRYLSGQRVLVWTPSER